MPEGLPPLRAGEDEVKEILLNLVLNGLEAMPEGGTLRVTARAGEGRAHLSVSDTGPGIPPELVGPGLRALLHHQERRHRPGPEHSARPHPADRRQHPVRQLRCGDGDGAGGADRLTECGIRSSEFGIEGNVNGRGRRAIDEAVAVDLFPHSEFRTPHCHPALRPP